MLSRSQRRRLAIGRSLVLSWRPTGARLVGLFRALVTSFVALGVSFYVLPGEQSKGPMAVLMLVVVVAAIGALLRPLLLGLAVLLGSFGLLLVGVLAQAGVLAIAVSLAPDVHVSSFAVIVGASWIAAIVAAAVNWLLDAGSQDAYLAQVLGRAVRVAHRHALDDGARAGEPGLLIVQLDGVGRGLLRQAVRAGAAPTLSGWVRAGTHRAYRWHTGLPATTPAGQAVLLYGDVHHVPSFRWYDRAAQRLLVANRPADAAEIERRISTGRGLLADGGVSISNLFSGDAPTRVLTMSDARLPPRTTRGLASFATGPLGLVRTVVVFVGQVIEELYQGRRQRRRDVYPRVVRGRLFALLRGVTTALLHDLNIAIVAEQMARGAPVIFVDFVDYDEVAHHAGPSRPESMRTLDDLDRVLGFLAQVAREVNRRYEIVVVSDHGQAQGEPFAQLCGQTLDELVASLAGTGDIRPELISDAPAEQWGPANLLLTAAARSRRMLGALARRRADRTDMTVTLGRPAQSADDVGLVVASSGSLAHITLTGSSERVDLATIEARHPRLVTGLAAHPGIGAVLVRTADRGTVAFGAGGWRSLKTGSGEGIDPLTPYGAEAFADLVDLDGRDGTGDIVVLGRYDPETEEVAAFEELVGSHGGLGGDQTEAVLFVPAGWPLVRSSRADEVLTGSDVHRALVDRLDAMGLRTGGEPRGADVGAMA